MIYELPECTLPDCDFCNGLDPEKVADYFLQESNAIEGVYDEDSLQQAKYAWEYLIEQPKLDGGVILKTHKILMLHQPLAPNQRGYWRNHDVQVGYRLCPNWRKVPDLIKTWIEDVATTLRVPGEKGSNINADHVSYEGIHPFADGNGRTGRMFLNWERLKVGLPLLIIHDENKQEYYKWFKDLKQHY